MPSPTKARLVFGDFSASSFSTSATLSPGRSFAADLVDAQLACDLLGYAARVAREHDGLGDAGLLEAGNGLGGVRLDNIRDDDVTGVGAVDRHMDDRADAVAVVIIDAELLHELGVACGDAVAVNGRRDAVAADLPRHS